MIALKEEIYFEILNLNKQSSVIELFYNSIIYTNQSFNFFTDWKKVKNNFNKYRIELNILNSLINDENFDDSLSLILKEYPKVLPIIPLLVAKRKENNRLLVIDDFYSKIPKKFNYDFNVRKLKNSEIKDFITFFELTGLKDFFLNLSQKSIPDYFIGVEVGSDSSARANRSGKIMEEFISNLLNEIRLKTKNSFSIIKQKKYKYLKEKYGYKITNALLERQADFFIVRNDRKIITIETNFYSDTGSKPQEIVNSYIQRQNELKKIDVEFIWITDGFGWLKQKNQMNFAFERLDFISNIYFLKMGLLEHIITSV